jgi:heme-degrading monooxygenase HmoA
MFARNAHFRVKSLSMAEEFARTFQKEVVPLLRAQEGFKGEVMLSNPGSLERITISLWETKDHAEAYDANVYPKVLKILAKVVDGTPKIRTFEAATLSVDQGTAERQRS